MLYILYSISYIKHNILYIIYYLNYIKYYITYYFIFSIMYYVLCIVYIYILYIIHCNIQYIIHDTWYIIDLMYIYIYLEDRGKSSWGLHNWYIGIIACLVYVCIRIYIYTYIYIYIYIVWYHDVSLCVIMCHCYHIGWETMTISVRNICLIKLCHISPGANGDVFFPGDPLWSHIAIACVAWSISDFATCSWWTEGASNDFHPNFGKKSSWNQPPVESGKTLEFSCHWLVQD